MSLPEKARRDEHEIAELQDLLSRLQTHEEDGTVGGFFDTVRQVQNKALGINRASILGLCTVLMKAQAELEDQGAKFNDQLTRSFQQFMASLGEHEPDPKLKRHYISELKAHWDIVEADLTAYSNNKRFTDLQTKKFNSIITDIKKDMTAYLGAWKGQLNKKPK